MLYIPMNEKSEVISVWSGSLSLKSPDNVTLEPKGLNSSPGIEGIGKRGGEKDR